MAQTFDEVCKDAGILERNPSLVPIYEELLAKASERDVLVGREEFERIREMGLSKVALNKVWSDALLAHDRYQRSANPDRRHTIELKMAEQDAYQAWLDASVTFSKATHAFFGIAP